MGPKYHKNAIPPLGDGNLLSKTTRKPSTCVTPAVQSTGSSSGLQLSFNHAKINDAGEDADPINMVLVPPHGLIAVFDGLGGSGSEKYRDLDGSERTGAYIASRLVRKHVVTYCESHRIPVEINANALNPLKSAIRNEVDQRAATYTRSESRILSSMRRTLPTTMAGVFYTPTPQGNNTYQCDVVWAGDSRVYCLTPSAGLQQLTRDHVKGSTHDTLQDFVQDSPISNCIHANADFNLDHKRFMIPGPMILIAATDGCYSGLASPAHFEYILLAQLKQSTHCEEWSTRLRETLCAIAQDDVSMSIIGLGVSDFGALQQAFHTRTDELETKMRHYKIFASTPMHKSSITQQLELPHPDTLQQRLAAFWDEYYHTTYTARLKEHIHER